MTIGKIAWYFFGITLLIMAILTFITAMNVSLNCSSYLYNDYGSYLYCRNFRNRQMLMSIFEVIGSLWCFGMGSIFKKLKGGLEDGN